MQVFFAPFLKKANSAVLVCVTITMDIPVCLAKIERLTCAKIGLWKNALTARVRCGIMDAER